MSNPIHGGDAQGAIAGSKPSKYHKSSIVSFSGTGSAIDVLLSYAAEQNMSSIQEGNVFCLWYAIAGTGRLAHIVMTGNKL